MSAKASMVAGILLMALSASSVWFRFGQVPVHVYLPDSPATRAVEKLVGDEPAGPPPPTPMRLLIPAIGVDASVEELGLTAAGTIDTPRRWEEVSWYSGSALPGKAGVSIISGHVDSHIGAAVFYKLHQLKPGNHITVSGGGRTVAFEVVSLRSYPENSLPRDELLSTDGPPRLALLTCSGDFNRLTQRYDDRLVVMSKAVSGD
ncbi:MAG: class F sortase [Chloroflexota bacterium]|nr:class F sortase [Chloroflexota bacterium]